ncbi:M50 family metallopeptidase [Marinococcus luteus]|uniref:M50 family metallopeptidase n=1 Tax=Marinococcus luteus TaxID=1122204 RepID=UPI002ACCB0DC|nr:M50 family metallopeptidase [Marinococcus luteus]MDZ5784476.1 M50 family metallopeptidase [Marinococcus luteus]
MMETILFFLTAAVVLTALTYTPVLGTYLSLFQTMVHENGHAFMALATGGKVRSISLFYTREGLAETGHKGKLGQALTTFAGYPFASGMALLYSWVFTSGWYSGLMIALVALFIWNTLLWVRNPAGIIWGLAASGGGLYLLIENMVMLMMWIMFILGVLLVIQSVRSAWIILQRSLQMPGDAGDATGMHRVSRIPAQVWGVLFFTLALAAAWFSAGFWLQWDSSILIQGENA